MKQFNSIAYNGSNQLQIMGVMGKTILGLLFGISLCCGSAQAQLIGITKTKITGAFGLNLYEKLDPNKVGYLNKGGLL